MNARIHMNDEKTNYSVVEDGCTYDAIHTSGTVCMCQHETPTGYDCAVFFADAGGSKSGDLRLAVDGDTHEIDGSVYEASSVSGWVQVVT